MEIISMLIKLSFWYHLIENHCYCLTSLSSLFAIFFFLVWGIESGSTLPQSDFSFPSHVFCLSWGFPKLPRLVLNLGSSCFSLQGSWNYRYVCHHAFILLFFIFHSLFLMAELWNQQSQNVSLCAGPNSAAEFLGKVEKNWKESTTRLV